MYDPDIDVEECIRSIQGFDGGDFHVEPSKDRSWAWVLYPAGILCLGILVFVFGCACAQAYVALDAVL